MDKRSVGKRLATRSTTAPGKSPSKASCSSSIDQDDRTVSTSVSPTTLSISTDAVTINSETAPPTLAFIAANRRDAGDAIAAMAQLCGQLMREAEQVERAVGSAQSHAIQLGQQMATERLRMNNQQRVCAALETAVAAQRFDNRIDGFMRTDPEKSPEQLRMIINKEFIPLSLSVIKYVTRLRYDDASAMIAQKMAQLDPVSADYAVDKIQLQYLRATVLYSERKLGECIALMDEARLSELPPGANNVVIEAYVLLMLIKALVECQASDPAVMELALRHTSTFARLVDASDCDPEFARALLMARRDCHMMIGVVLVHRGHAAKDRDFAKREHYPEAERHLRSCLELLRRGVVEGISNEEMIMVTEALIDVCTVMEKTTERILLAVRLVTEMHNEQYAPNTLSIYKIAEGAAADPKEAINMDSLRQKYEIFRNPVRGELVNVWRPILSFLIRIYRTSDKPRSTDVVRRWCALLFPTGSKHSMKNSKQSTVDQ